MIILATGDFDYDYWKLKIVNNGRVMQNNGLKRCTLTSKDRGNLLTYSVTEDNFCMNMISVSQHGVRYPVLVDLQDGCSTKLDDGTESGGYDSYAFVRVSLKA